MDVARRLKVKDKTIGCAMSLERERTLQTQILGSDQIGLDQYPKERASSLAKLLDRSVVIRELMPQDLKIEIERLNKIEALSLSRYLASVVGRGSWQANELATTCGMALGAEQEPQSVAGRSVLVVDKRR